jgi:hypothetical protein
MEWLGHLIRMGRPRLHWLEDKKNDLWELQVKIWRQKAIEKNVHQSQSPSGNHRAKE